MMTKEEIGTALEWASKWDCLTKTQKTLIRKLWESEGNLTGTFSDINRKCGIKTVNLTANRRQIVQLQRWGIISISEPLGNSKVIRLYTLVSGWADRLMSTDFSGFDKSSSYYERWEK